MELTVGSALEAGGGDARPGHAVRRGRDGRLSCRHPAAGRRPAAVAVGDAPERALEAAQPRGHGDPGVAPVRRGRDERLLAAGGEARPDRDQAAGALRERPGRRSRSTPRAASRTRASRRSSPPRRGSVRCFPPSRRSRSARRWPRRRRRRRSVPARSSRRDHPSTSWPRRTRRSHRSRVPSWATARRDREAGSVRFVHDVPSGDVRRDPPTPTATNRPEPNETSMAPGGTPVAVREGGGRPRLPGRRVGVVAEVDGDDDIRRPRPRRRRRSRSPAATGRRPATRRCRPGRRPRTGCPSTATPARYDRAAGTFAVRSVQLTASGEVRRRRPNPTATNCPPP